MRLAILSDVHDHYDSLSKLLARISKTHSPELWVFTGDIGKEISLFNAVINRLAEPQVVIYGNHDSEDIIKLDNRPRTWILKFGEHVRIKDLTFLGIPGNRGSKSKWTHWTEDEVQKIIDLGEKVDVVVSHECPLGVADFKNGAHSGQRILRELIIKISPRLFVCGHIHAGIQCGRLMNTVVVNSGAVSYLDLSPPEYVIADIGKEIVVRGFFNNISTKER
ncbi:MAG: metallophosphoesterase family protein [Candidatus Korarchaeota archaeon]